MTKEHDLTGKKGMTWNHEDSDQKSIDRSDEGR